ncbi:hypothetical protein EPN87_01050 [archaeon]|nr:MAG: hypothetical protein EPN87_01050 [archaeon]
MNRIFKIFAPLLILSTLISPPVLAQDNTDMLRSVMTAFLGQLPSSCYSDFGSQSCMECMAIGKLFPLALLTALFFFAFYYVMKYIHGGEGTPSPTELRIAAVVGIVIGLLFLHTASIGSALMQTVFWMQIGLIILIIIFVGSVGKSTAKGWIWVIFAIIILAFLAPLIWSQFGQITSYFTSTCVS